MEFHESKRMSAEGKQKVALVDIDETICFYSGTRRYDLSEPNQDNINKINSLYEAGWKIVYWTARGSRKQIDWTELTTKQLNEWGAKYHELKVNKPFYDVFIEDKAFRIEEI